MPGRKYQPEPSRFRTCLNNVPVPTKMFEGLEVVKVTYNGKTKPAYLTLAPDRFTIYTTQSKLKNGKVSKMETRRPLLRKVTSIGSNDEEPDHETKIDIGSIDRLQSGQTTLRFELAKIASTRIASPRRSSTTDFIELDPNRSLSIIFSNERTLDIMINDGDITRDVVLETLQNLLNNYTRAKVNVGNDVLLLRYLWVDVDKDQSDSINAHELSKLLNRINYSIKRSDSDRIYHSFAKMFGLDRNDRKKGISFELAVTILHKFKRDSGWQIKPVQNIWFDLFGRVMNNGKDRTKVSAESFLRKFMLKKQGESQFTMEEVGKVFRHLNGLEVADVATNLNFDATDPDSAKYIDRDRFEAYLYSKQNGIFDPKKETLHQNMDFSLTEYWINSSHNTYLTGDQFSSRSSVEMYVNALHRGCRCLELDCFNGHRDRHRLIPSVYHGGTITTKISFIDIIEAIKFFLHSNPDCFPIILSLENHCTLPYQDAMASSMIEIFGDSLFIPDEDNLDDPLPSPNELRGKVLLKGRRITDKKEDYYQGSTFDDSDTEDSEIEEEHTMDRDDRPLSPKANVSRQAPTIFSSELSRITIFHGVKWNSFEESERMSKDCMISIDETKARRMSKIEEHRTDWIRYNQTHLSRVYPSAKRVDSSNFNPMTAWSKGCQLVALNLQTSDAARRLNDGRFRENGDCGYILKPPSLRSGNEEVTPVSLSIKVLCGSCLPKPQSDKRTECIDPYVQVSVFDVSTVTGRERYSEKYTNHVSRGGPNKNGFNPIWLQDSPFKFKVENLDVAILQFTVWDRDVGLADNIVGSASIPISCVREGYRSVNLFDSNNKRNGPYECASLLVDLEMEEISQQIPMW